MRDTYTYTYTYMLYTEAHTYTNTCTRVYEESQRFLDSQFLSLSLIHFSLFFFLIIYENMKTGMIDQLNKFDRDVSFPSFSLFFSFLLLSFLFLFNEKIQNVEREKYRDSLSVFANACNTTTCVLTCKSTKGIALLARTTSSGRWLLRLHRKETLVSMGVLLYNSSFILRAYCKRTGIHRDVLCACARGHVAVTIVSLRRRI